MLVRLSLIISALLFSPRLANSNPVLEFRDQEEPQRELMIDQPQKVNGGEMSKLIYLEIRTWERLSWVQYEFFFNFKRAESCSNMHDFSMKDFLKTKTIKDMI